jgi:alginate O-acetyltransferase complex protein AlgI
VNFPSGTFLLFFVVVFAAHWALPRPRWRKVLLLAASYYFYMSWNVELVVLILLSTVVDYVVGLRLAAAETPRARRGYLLVSLVVNLGLLGYFKYAGFFVESFGELLASLGMQANTASLEIILPVGISFYTFQTLSYTIDIYRKSLQPTRDLLDFALFVAFFPQLVAGPIVRASHFLPQLATPVRWDRARAAAGLQRMVIGLAKKIVLADSFAIVANEVFASPESFGFAGSWFGVIAFAFQIYCDFSAYSDIAIGAAATLGYEIPENFAHPYVAGNIREFWRRWHMSLSTWLRDYLYIPLGGSRRGATRARLNLLITMFLGGLWHGAAWTFVAWGVFHGLLLGVQRWIDERRPGGAGKPRSSVVGIVPTFALVCLGWVLFRAETFADAALLYRNLFGLRSVADSPMLRTPVLWMVLAMVIVHVQVHFAERRALAARPAPAAPAAPAWPLLWRTAFLTLCVGGIVAFFRDDGVAFIYFQF